MDIPILLFLTSGLFLGWALGGNDAANVFGTAVGTRMVRFTTAAIICSVFVILGSVISGAGAAHTLGKLGAVNALGGSFMAALAAAFAVYTMTKFGLPVSTTQAIVGAIIGWNLFSDGLTDSGALIKILSTWVICPVLAAVIAILLFKLVNRVLSVVKLHLLRTDAYTRAGLLLAGAFGAYSLGANNIANVMGVFVTSSPFTDFSVAGMFTVSSTQQLFLIGGLAIAAGVMTYSKRVMTTVGDGLLPLSPIAAWVAVMAHSIVLFVFASQGLEALLADKGLPTIPLVPVSSSQAVVGAVIGIGILKGGRGLRWRVLGGIGLGWILTPLMAGLICFVGLFFMQNVFDQTVYRPIAHALSPTVMARIEQAGIKVAPIIDLEGRQFETAARLKAALDDRPGLDDDDRDTVISFARRRLIFVDPARFPNLAGGSMNSDQLAALAALAGRSFSHTWAFDEALAAKTPAWHLRPDNVANRSHNRRIRDRQDHLHRVFGLTR